MQFKIGDRLQRKLGNRDAAWHSCFENSDQVVTIIRIDGNYLNFKEDINQDSGWDLNYFTKVENRFKKYADRLKSV
jgi:hypothetical protein